MMGISNSWRMRVTCFFTESMLEKISRTTAVPEGHRIFWTASLAVLPCILRPSTDWIMSPGKSPDFCAGEPGRTHEI